MRGAISVIGFGLLGLLVVAIAWSVNGQIGWCGEKGPCGNASAADLGSLAGSIAIGIVGLLAIMLIANGLFRLLRSRRPQG